MAKFRVLVSRTVLALLGSLDKDTQNRIKSALAELESDPFKSRPKADIKKLHKLSKHDLYRLRVGDYRIVYSVESAEVKVAKLFRSEKGYEWFD